MPGKSPHILVVEDNPADAYLIEQALRQADPDCRIFALSNGDSAIQYLSDEAPEIVVLDLNIPGRDGVEVLHFIGEELRLSRVVVVVFSSSPVDAIERKAPQAHAHIQKPFDLDMFLAVGEKILHCYRQAHPDG